MIRPSKTRSVDVTERFSARELLTMLPAFGGGYGWGDTMYPLAGDTVVTADGRVGTVMHTCPRRPLLPSGGMHRYVHVSDGEVALAWHISQLRPFELATEIN